MVKQLTDSSLDTETQQYAGTGGVSQHNGEFGFIPAFLDCQDGCIYLSRTVDGRLAKIHVLDGLPEQFVVSREKGRVTAVQKSLLAGFVLDGVFFTRDQAAQFVNDKMSKSA